MKIEKLFVLAGGRKALFLLLLIVSCVISSFFIENIKYDTLLKYLSIMYASFCAGNGLEYFMKK